MSDELTNEETAYFESKGEKQPSAAPAPIEKQEAVNEPVAEAKPEAASEAVKEAPQSDEEKPEAKADTGSDDVADASDDADDAEAKKRRRVSYSAYERERQQRRETETKLAKIQEDHAKQMEAIAQRLASMHQSQQPSQPLAPETPAIPDPDQDIFGATKFAIDKIMQIEAEKKETQQRAMAERQAMEQQRQNTIRHAQYQKDVIDTYNDLGQKYAEENPGFTDIYAYARQSRIKQLMRDEGLDEASAKQFTTREEFVLADRTLKTGQNPFDRIKNYAIDMGYRAAEQKKPEVNPQRLDHLSKGQEANKSISGVGSSGSARGSIGAADLAKMNQDEFSAFLDKHGDKGFRAAITRA